MTFSVAFAIGFSVASIPGPTIVLIATETIRRGLNAGLLTMIAPLVLDAMVMLPLGLFLQASLLSGSGAVALGLLGVALLFWLGLQSLRAGANKFRVSGHRFRELDPSMNSLRLTQGLSLSKAGSTLSKAERVEAANSKLETSASSDREMPSFLKGFLTHLMSPYPYLYWGTVGSTFVRQGYQSGGFTAAALFPLGFWSGTTTFTLLAVCLLARGRRLLPPRLEPYLHHFSGAVLIGSGILLAVKVWHGPF